jgi:hypothetical protein
MASRIKALNAYRPKLKLGRTVQMDELVEHITGRTGLNTGEIISVLAELHDAIVFFGRQGVGVKLERLGTYLPSIRLDGTLDVQHRLDWGLRRDLNRGEYTGRMLNRENVGKTPDDLVAQWNAEHQDDPVEE